MWDSILCGSICDRYAIFTTWVNLPKLAQQHEILSIDISSFIYLFIMKIVQKYTMNLWKQISMWFMTELLSKVRNEPTAGQSILTEDCSWSLLATRPRNKFCRLIRYSLEYIAQSSHARKHAITFCCVKNEHDRHTKICKYFTTMSTTTS